MGNNFYNRGASFNPDELADGDAIEAEFDAVARGFDTIEDLVNVNKAGYPTQTFHVATATESTHAVPKAQMDAGLELKLNATSYTAADVLSKIKTVDGSSSGLDADLLDGQEGSYYRNASNINNGTLAKERLPASIDASTSGNAATASKVSNTAPNGGTADLVSGVMAGSDFFRIRVGGGPDAGWTEIATADNGNEPIYVRQYTGDFVTVARTVTMLDGSGNTSFPGSVSATEFSGPLTGNASTATTLQTARTINNVSFNGGANITVEPYIETDSSNASSYLTFVDSVTAGYQRLNMDSGLTYNPSTNVLSATVTSDINEVGKVVAFAKSSAPSGFLKCNGAAVSRTTYAALYAAIGTTFGSGDGSTTFNVPDLRGEFVRGWDDARGIDSGRTFGSWQDGQNVSHTHTGTTSSDAHTHTWSGTTSSYSHAHSVASVGTSPSGGSTDGVTKAGSTTRTTSTDTHTHTVSGTTSSDSHTHTMTTAASGGTEVRVRNRALLYCIKY